MDEDLAEREAFEIGRRVREELARRRLSRQALADMARVSRSTLEKALAGTRPFASATTIRLEESLDVRLRGAPAPVAAPTLAPEAMGAYTRTAVRWIKGRYLTLRPSFGNPGCIYAYLVTIRWIDEAGHLGSAESKRTDAEFEQAGHGSQLVPLAGPIALVRLDDAAEAATGLVEPGAPDHARYAGILGGAIARDFVRFPGPAPV